MAQLIVRNIEDAVKNRLADLARRHGRSMEEEVRSILRAAVREDAATKPPVGVGTRLANCFAGLGLDAELPPLPKQAARPARFDD